MYSKILSKTANEKQSFTKATFPLAYIYYLTVNSIMFPVKLRHYFETNHSLFKEKGIAQFKCKHDLVKSQTMFITAFQLE